MGQSYEAYVIDDNGCRIYNPSIANSYFKLTEHGYITSPFVNVILEKILDTPKRVAWVGDYALDSHCKLPQKTKDKIKECSKNHNEEEQYVFQLNINKIEDCCGMVLLNHDKKEYVHLDNYIKKNARVQIWKTEERSFSANKINIRCLSPLALLTACGNGMGGGDYEGSDEQMVGRWAFDRIELTSAKDGYACFSEICPRFVESWMES